MNDDWSVENNDMMTKDVHRMNEEDLDERYVHQDWYSSFLWTNNNPDQQQINIDDLPMCVWERESEKKEDFYEIIRSWSVDDSRTAADDALLEGFNV